MRMMQPLAAFALVLTACSPHVADGKAAPSSEAAAVHPVSGLPVIPLTVQRGQDRLKFRVELAATSAQQAQGLMFRSSMAANEGMIFPMDPPRSATFWMKNTVIPLDIIFIGTDGKVLNIAANATPYSETPLPSDGVAKGVLELNGGRAAQLGIVPGDQVDW
jgi:uncharacterized protein